MISRPVIKSLQIVSLAFILVAQAALAADPVDGKIVRDIKIRVRRIFDGDNLNMIYRKANEFKFQTRKHVIQQELLCSKGDTIDRFTIDESIRNLRRLRYLRRVKVRPVVDGKYVDLHVSAQDTWTIIPQLSISSGDGRDKIAVGIADSNVLGYGKRLEFQYQEEDNRDSLAAVWDDNRVWGSPYRLVSGLFLRNDGEVLIGDFSKPFRSLLDKNSWTAKARLDDTIGRLFSGGDERFIFRQDIFNADLSYTVAKGDPEVERRRFTFGYRLRNANFEEARSDDPDTLDIDSSTLDQDPSQLASDRRYSGPVLGYQNIEPKFISMNYIDRFERVEDYNLGDTFAVNFHFAPQFLGSKDDALLFSTNRSRGKQFSDTSFIRGEVGLATRLDGDALSNSLLRGEVKYYNVLGNCGFTGHDLGIHTLAASAFVDYGDDLDRDRELLVGGDNGLRGYDARTFTGDKRYAINLEDRIHLYDDILQLFSLGATVFLDVGGATNERFSKLFSDSTYSDIGVGLRFAFPRFSDSKVLRLDIAFPLRDGPDGSDEFEPRVIASVGQLFNSFLRSERVGAEQATTNIGFDR